MPPRSEINFNATCYKNVNLSLTGSRTDGQIYVSTFARPEHYMPPHTDGRGIKKRKRRGEGEGAAKISDFFYKESKSKKN